MEFISTLLNKKPGTINPMNPNLSQYFSKLGRAGGKKRAQTMTKEQRVESARAAAVARWARWLKAKAKAAAKVKNEPMP